MAKIDKYNEEKDIREFINDLSKAHDSEALFVFVGAGVSASQLYPNWDEYVEKLISYWIVKLDECFGAEYQPEDIKTLQSDIHFLEELNKRNVSNKRKVDLVHAIIRNHCKIALLNEKEEKDKLLSFERKYFRSIPMLENNVTLDNLINLQPIFLTTNYDNEIERRLKQYYKNIKVVVDISKIENVKSLSYRSVVHLHGAPDDMVDMNYFISSSASYSKLYYSDNSKKYVESFRKILSRQGNGVILFVGCSMEEEEVLSLFDFKSPTSTITTYALMKYSENHENDALDLIYNTTIKRYYRNEKGIRFIWYGNEFKDLPSATSYIEIEVKKQKTQILEGEINSSILHKFNSAESDATKIEILNNLYEQKKAGLINSIFKRSLGGNPSEVLKLIHMIIDSKIFFVNSNEKGFHLELYDVWEIILNNIQEIDETHIKKLLLFIKEIGSLGYSLETTLFKVVNFFIKKMEDSEKYKSIKLYFEKFLKLTISNPSNIGISDRIINTYWLITKLSNNDYILIDELEENTYDFSVELFNDFVSFLTKLQDKHNYSNLEYIESNETLYVLQYLLMSSKIMYQGSYLLPDNFYKILIIQKFYVKIFCTDQVIESHNDILKKIIKSIDFSNKYFGSKLNDFILKFNDLVFENATLQFEDSLLEYRDSFKVLNVEPENYPIIDFKSIKTRVEIDDVISRFNNIIQENTKEYVQDYFFQQNQNISEHVKSYDLTKEDWIIISEFFDEVIMLEDIRGFLIYSLVEIYDKGLSLNCFNFDKFKTFFSHLSHNGILNSFDTHIENVFRKSFNYYNDNKVTQSELLRYLFSCVNIQLLFKTSDIDFNKQINLISFLNSDIGRYIDLISRIDKTVIELYLPLLSKELLRIVKDSSSTYNYINGYLSNFKDCENCIDSSFFIGFSHRYHLNISSEKIALFSRVCLDIFQSGSKDQYLARNIALILVSQVDPPSIKGRTSVELMTSVWIQIVNLFTHGNHDKFIKLNEWVIWFLEKLDNAAQVIIQNSLSKLHQLDSDKIRMLISNFDSAKRKKGAYVRIYTLNVTSNITLLSIENHRNLLDLIIVLFQKKYFENSYGLVSPILEIIAVLHIKQETEIIEKYFDFLEENVDIDFYSRLDPEYLKYRSKKSIP